MYRDARSTRQRNTELLLLPYENPVQYFHKWTKDGATEEIGYRI